ncbi:MAG TPA: hypothetical protein VFJ74_08055 [Gemmatimonadaceae bacterium]|nr:hypothetical protein [Gemmatimonadaceae bacterium]
MKRAGAAKVAAVLLLLPSAAVLTACPHNTSHASTAPTSGDSAAVALDEAAAPVTVSVENRNHLDVIVYAVHEGGARERLGLVTSGSVGRFNLPRRAAARGGDLYLVAHPVGTNDNYLSDRVNPQPGQRVTWTLQQGMERSSIVVQ